MRFLSLVRVTETGQQPSQRLMNEMGVLIEEMSKSGALVSTAGLKPSREGKRMQWNKGKVSTTDGPFTETKELVAGYWIWEVASLEEAVEWLKRAPFDGGAEVELRPFITAEDFGEEFTPELQEQEARLRAESEQG